MAGVYQTLDTMGIQSPTMGIQNPTMGIQNPTPIKHKGFIRTVLESGAIDSVETSVLVSLLKKPLLSMDY